MIYRGVEKATLQIPALRQHQWRMRGGMLEQALPTLVLHQDQRQTQQGRQSQRLPNSMLCTTNGSRAWQPSPWLQERPARRGQIGLQRSNLLQSHPILSWLERLMELAQQQIQRLQL
jgi:hypothetical protein